jgi:hypothetical protein
MDLAQMVEAGPYPFRLDTARGATLISPDLPPLAVVHAAAVRVREVHWQALLCRTADQQTLQVQRLVAVLESNEEVELQRQVAPVDAATALPVDQNRCVACGGNVPQGTGIIFEGRTYHCACVR